MSVSQFEVGRLKCTAIADADVGARNVLLVDSAQRILIDTGVGSHDPGNPGRLLARLAEVGVEPASIDKVILTHADFDHIGGAATLDGQITFDGAEHWIMRTEVDFWRQRPTRLQPSPLYDEAFRSRVNSVPPTVIDVLADRLRLVEDGSEVMRGVTMIAAPGHTPGNAVVQIENEDNALLVVADLFYQPENLAANDWVSQYDYDPKLVVETRARLLQEAVRKGTMLMAYHLPFPGLGRVVRNRSARLWISA